MMLTRPSAGSKVRLAVRRMTLAAWHVAEAMVPDGPSF